MVNLDPPVKFRNFRNIVTDWRYLTDRQLKKEVTGDSDDCLSYRYSVLSFDGLILIPRKRVIARRESNRKRATASSDGDNDSKNEKVEQRKFIRTLAPQVRKLTA